MGGVFWSIRVVLRSLSSMMNGNLSAVCVLDRRDYRMWTPSAFCVPLEAARSVGERFE